MIKRVSRWLREGGKDEDEGAPYPRVINHFHDPLQQWSHAGIFNVGYSALIWAQDQSAPDNSPNLFTWKKARDNFYNALTTGSEQSYADTFLDLGHLMHLVSDMAVPAHVRLDPHLTLPTKWTDFIEDPDPFESWTADYSTQLNYTGTPVDPAIFSHAIASTAAPAPISALWDHDVYQQDTNPNITLTTGPMTVGLAEYTNANFFSKDTFAGYTYPDAGVNAVLDVDWYHPEEFVENGKTVHRVYLWRNVGGSAGPIKIAAASLISYDTLKKNTDPPWMIDNKVNEDYASRLVPAAVGYSTALLDYFFRGKIELTPPDRFVMGIIDDADFFDPNTGGRMLDAYGSPVEQEFTQLKAKVRNISADEMGTGTIQLVARYLGRNDYNPDLLNDPPQAASVQDGNGKFYPYSYSVSLPIQIASMSKTTATEHTFNFSNSPIPVGITDLDIFVVFKGTLGQEVDNAVAVGRIAEMNEPFHYAVMNNTTYSIGRTGTLTPLTGWSTNFQVCFNPYPGTCQQPPATTLGPGRYSKIIILYAGQTLGLMYKDNLYATSGSGGWLYNLSRSKFLAADNIAYVDMFRGVHSHASFLSYISPYGIDAYTIPAFVDPNNSGFLPFVPATPVHVNMAP